MDHNDFSLAISKTCLRNDHLELKSANVPVLKMMYDLLNLVFNFCQGYSLKYRLVVKFEGRPNQSPANE